MKFFLGERLRQRIMAHAEKRETVISIGSYFHIPLLYGALVAELHKTTEKLNHQAYNRSRGSLEQTP
jgi:hypothetical protein